MELALEQVHYLQPLLLARTGVIEPGQRTLKQRRHTVDRAIAHFAPRKKKKRKPTVRSWLPEKITPWVRYTIEQGFDIANFKFAIRWKRFSPNSQMFDFEYILKIKNLIVFARKKTGIFYTLRVL